jgi:hypothetical protein
MRLISRVIMIIILFIGLSLFAMAQPGDPGDPPRIPIDAGVSVLLAAGAIFGAKKIYDIQKKKK